MNAGQHGERRDQAALVPCARPQGGGVGVAVRMAGGGAVRLATRRRHGAGRGRVVGGLAGGRPGWACE